MRVFFFFLDKTYFQRVRVHMLLTEIRIPLSLIIAVFVLSVYVICLMEKTAALEVCIQTLQRVS